MPPTQRILRVGVRARRRRTAAVVGASCAVLAVGVVAATAVAQPSAPDGPSITAEAPSPRMELASAIAASENISYRVTATGTGTKSGGGHAPPGYTVTSEGAFDPPGRPSTCVPPAGAGRSG
ncbi:hypothetical protein [Plantactinospora sp. CA-290183]|uniref:hypothetical protein n=1 Tax=Plantactinospora sp. CA-290183 TaxID=3240006 RepID=UPI003D8CAB70